MALPPLPPGYRLQQPAKRDPWDVLQSEGFVATNGFRTEGDVERIRAQGYKPAKDGAHNNGDGVDLDHPKLSRQAQERRLRQLSDEHGWNAFVLDEGHHRHLAIKGWGAAPGTPGTKNSGLPPLPPGAKLIQRGKLSGSDFTPPAANEAPAPSGKRTPAPLYGKPTGEAYDGDTFKLSTGGNARLYAMDAPELNQTGQRRDGTTVPLGIQARDGLLSQLSGNPPVSLTGKNTFGRPVAMLGEDNSAAIDLLRDGQGVAVPKFLEGSTLFKPHIEAERLARQNRLGIHGTNAVTPAEHRKGITPESVLAGRQDDVRFWDDRTPFQGVRPEIEAAYLAFANDPAQARSVDDLVKWGHANGFDVSREHAGKFIEHRDKNPGFKAERADYLKNPAPRLMTNMGDGATGAFLRGVSDPLNVTDEVGGVIQTLGLPSINGQRENIWNSDRRWGDIAGNNIDQNRAIFQYDDEYHPVARFGGQMASALVAPTMAVEGAAARATVKALEKGASHWAAAQAGRTAAGRAYMGVGAVEGGIAGAGAGEGGLIDRAPGAAVGAVLGGTAGVALGKGMEAAAPYVIRGLNNARTRFGPAAAPMSEDMALRAAAEAMPIANDGVQQVGPTPAAKSQPQGGVAAMRMDDEELVGPEMRQRDYINAADLPPLPEGYALQDPPVGRTMQMGERVSPEAMAQLADGVDPASVLPRPSNIVESMDEAAQANPGRFRELEAPDEHKQLDVRRIPSKTDLLKSRNVRGPIDMTQWLRDAGGLRDDTGDLAHLGIDNEARKLDFGGHEGFLGKLVHERGMSLDEAGEALTSAGYFKERPTTDELLDALHQERLGNRRFRDEEVGEAEAFYSARADRERIEAQAETGSPYVDDVTEEVTLDDLVNNDPPANAYEERPQLMGKLGNINLGYIEKSGDVAQLIDQIQKRVGGFSAASRGKVTNEETVRLAEEMGLKPEQLLKRRQGQALNAEQLYATRVLAQKSREVVAKLAKKAAGGSDEDLARFRNAWLRHVAIEEQVTGATAEVGRALQQMKIAARSASANSEAVRAYLKGAGGRETIEDAARAIVDLIEDPAKASHFMREAFKPKWRDRFNELWVNSLLSGPKTHVVNMVGNGLTAMLSMPEAAMTAGIGAVTRSADRARFGEVGARAVGMADSALEGLRAAKVAFRTGEPSDAISKVEARHHKAIPNFGKERTIPGVVPLVGGLKTTTLPVGSMVRMPTKALTAADEFWKAINRGAELRQLAYRRAVQEGGDAASINDRYTALVRSPSEGMHKAADDAARYYTFQKELGTTGKHIQQIANEFPGMKIILPFVRTPINLLKFAGERSVLGLAMPEVRAALKAGGRARDEAIARITLGSGISTAAVMMAIEGKVTGSGPSDPRERAALLQSGWQPNSVKVGEQWVSYQRFDPVSTLVGVAADFAEVGQYATEKEREDFAKNLGIAIAKNITNKTWLSGLSDFFEMMSDPDRFGPGYFRRLGASMAVPAISSQSAQALDPYMRDAKTLMDAIKARVPVLSESVPVRRDVWGEAIQRGDSVGPDLVSPIYSTQISKDPVNREVARLRVPLSAPQRHLKVGGKRVDLTPKQYDELVQLTGKPAKAYLAEIIGSDDWKAMDDDERRETVSEALRDFRANARDVLKERYPELGGAPAAVNDDLPPLPAGFVVRN